MQWPFSLVWEKFQLTIKKLSSRRLTDKSKLLEIFEAQKNKNIYLQNINEAEMLKINRFWWKYFKKVILFYKALHNIIEIKCQLNRLYQHIFFWSLKTTQKRYMILFKTKSTTAVDPRHLKVKE